MDFLPDFLMNPVLGQPLSFWLLFLGIVLGLLVFDLGLLNRNDHAIGARESLRLTAIYVLVSCLFGVWLWRELGREHGMHFFTAFILEKSLSMDNLFVMSVIFSYFVIPREYQHRVLFWGIIGVIIMRGIMIGFGAALVHRFEWVLLLFAGFLIFTGIKMMLTKEEEESNIAKSRVIQFLQKRVRVAPCLHGHAFFVNYDHTDSPRRGWHVTMLFLALVTIECADLVFAVDSIPAVLAITDETFVVYTSNIFAVVGLRAMYFAVAAIIHRFVYMRYILSVILVFIGMKAFYAHFFGEFPAYISLAITMFLLLGGIGFSLLKTRSDNAKQTSSSRAPSQA